MAFRANFLYSCRMNIPNRFPIFAASREKMQCSKLFRTSFFFLFFVVQCVCAFAQELNGNLELDLKSKAADSLLVDSLLNYARSHKYTNAETAYANALTALHISEDIKYKRGLLTANTYLGNQMADWTDYTKALKYYQQGLQTAEEMGNAKETIRFNLLIGNLYDNKKEYPEALSWYNSALNKALNEEDSLFAAYAIGNKAMIMDKTGHLDSAYLFNRQNLRYLANGVGDALDSANTFTNLALNQKRQKRYDQALRYMLKAKTPLLLSSDTFSIQVWYNNLGSLLISMGRLTAAKAKLDSALLLEPIVQSKLINEDLYNNLSHYYEAKKDYASALEWYKKSRMMTDSIRDQKEAAQFAALRIRYEVDKKESLLAKQKMELRQKNTINLIVIIGAVLLMALVILLYWSNRKRKKVNGLLTYKNRQISTQKEALQEANNVKNRLFSIISHDLRTPLQPLIFYLGMLSRDKLSKEVIQDIAKELQLHLRHTRIMMDNVLHWAASQMEGWELHPETVAVQPVFHEILDMLASDAKKKNIFFKDQISPSLYAVSDPELLKLVFRNILTNAIKFTPEGGTIEILGKKDQEGVCISISDNGIGISPEKRKQFEKGNPLKSTPGTHKETGTGIGLLVSRQLLVKQGGQLEIESEEGKGTTVFIKLL